MERQGITSEEAVPEASVARLRQLAEPDGDLDELRKAFPGF
jgi:hypothetical protein